MRKEKKSLEIDVYFDGDEGTCARDFKKGEVCLFYYTSSFGTREMCQFSKGEILDRRRDDQTGTPIPCENCPIHNA